MGVAAQNKALFSSDRTRKGPDAESCEYCSLSKQGETVDQTELWVAINVLHSYREQASRRTKIGSDTRGVRAFI